MIKRIALILLLVNVTSGKCMQMSEIMPREDNVDVKKLPEFLSICSSHLEHALEDDEKNIANNKDSSEFYKKIRSRIANSNKKLPYDLSDDQIKSLNFINKYSNDFITTQVNNKIAKYYESAISDKELVKIIKDKFKDYIKNGKLYDTKIISLFNNKESDKYINYILQKNIYHYYEQLLNLNEKQNNYKSSSHKEKVQFILQFTSNIKNEFRRNYIIKLMYKKLTHNRLSWYRILTEDKNACNEFHIMETIRDSITKEKENWIEDLNDWYSRMELDFNDLNQNEQMKCIAITLNWIRDGYITNPRIIEFINNVNEARKNYDSYLKEFDIWSYEQLKNKYSNEIITGINSYKNDMSLVDDFREELKKIAIKTNRKMNTLFYDNKSINLINYFIHNNIYSIFYEDFKNKNTEKSNIESLIEQTAAKIDNNLRRLTIYTLFNQYLLYNNNDNLDNTKYFFNTIKIKGLNIKEDDTNILEHSESDYINFILNNTNLDELLDNLYCLINTGHITNPHLVDYIESIKNHASFDDLFKNLTENGRKQIREYVTEHYDTCLAYFCIWSYDVIQKNCCNQLIKAICSNEPTIETYKKLLFKTINNTGCGEHLKELLCHYFILLDNKYDESIFNEHTIKILANNIKDLREISQSKDNTIEKLECKVEELTADNNQKENTINSLNSQINELKTNVNNYWNNIQSLQNQIYQLNNMLNFYQNNNNNFNNKY